MKQDQTKELIKTIQETTRLFSQYTRTSVTDQHATHLQFQALDLIKRLPDSSLSTVASELRLSKSSATQLIERLVTAGFVSREQDNDDKRVIKLSLTTSGSKERDILAKKLHSHCSLLLNQIPQEDLEQLLIIHKKLLKHLRSIVPDSAN